MKTVLAVVFALLLPAAALAADASQQAADSAKIWLGLIDTADYSQSWKGASPLFQNRISEADWIKAVKPIRESLGAVVSRVPAGVDLTKTLPGAPDGEYAIVHFKTKFARKADATETVTMMKDGGVWKCAGYFIK
jgi:hypothetical protein